MAARERTAAMERVVQVAMAVAAPMGALYGFTPVQTEAAIALVALNLNPVRRVHRVRRP